MYHEKNVFSRGNLHSLIINLLINMQESGYLRKVDTVNNTVKDIL